MNKEAYPDESREQVSPYTKQEMLYLSQLLPYSEASEVMERLWLSAPSGCSFWRLTQTYGKALEEIEEKNMDIESVEISADREICYIMADGSMLFTDDGWQECKAGRIFESAACSKEEEIKESLYVAHLGGHEEFIEKMDDEIAQKSHAKKVFLSDGAVWLKKWADRSHPEAVQILDYWHALEHVSEALGCVLGDKTEKLAALKVKLLASEIDEVCRELNVLAMPLKDKTIVEKTINYLQKNKYRMDYKSYREQGLRIGSGAMESTHLFLIHQRMKRTGQRWSDNGCQNLLNLRCAFQSNKEHLIQQLIAS